MTLERHEELRDVMAQVAASDELRKLALTDPHAAIKQASGKDVAHGITVKVIESNVGLAVAVDLADDTERMMPSGGNCCHIPNALMIRCV